MAAVTTFTALLDPAPLRIAAVFPVLGAAFHQCIRTIEIDNRVKSLLALYMLAWLSLCIAYFHVYSLSVPTAIGCALLAACCFNFGLTTSILLYRAFFHRLRRFPGPWSARLSRLSTVKRVAKRTQYHLDLVAMHSKYGDFVRTGPREISINRPAAVIAINGAQSSCTKSPWYSHVSDDKTQISLNSTRDPDVHRRRRKAWDRGFSTKALATYEPSVQRKINVLALQIRARKNQPLNISQWAMFLAFDIMGLVGFSKDFRQLEDGTELSAIKELHGQMLFLGILKPIPWILTVIGAIQGLMGNYGQFMVYCEDRIAEKKKQWSLESDKNPKDVISWLLKAIDEKDQCAPPGDQALNEDGRLMMIAGSDTAGATIAHSLYYLARTPSACKALQAELDNAFPNPTNASTFSNDEFRNLPYLEAVINETLRLKPAVPSGQPRVTPPEGLQVEEVWIPGDTIVFVPQYVIQRDERYFPSGAEFIPERWLDQKDKLIANEDAFFPFQLGRYSCVGKQLALMELRGTIARLAYDFDISFADGVDGVSFDTNSKDTFTFTIESLNLVFKERVRA
ncbi:putative cytochrome P450 [Aspergillus taichungensis]|uniref:Putative cytochrome P450 n=1 Tax=Aspergillus taichungensis TaxID=482145 RepID=A0A2J5HTI3_9EURO|nr:putative cytochrome P450 [Aspergillus taichungensis]